MDQILEKPAILKGTLHRFQDGPNDPVWALSIEGRAYPVFIETGDTLTVFRDAAKSTTLWNGIVALDHAIEYVDYALHPECGPPCSQRAYGNGFPRATSRGNISPLKWLDWFLWERPAWLIKTGNAPQP